MSNIFSRPLKKGKVRQDSEVNEKSCKGKQLYCFERENSSILTICKSKINLKLTRSVD